MDTIDSITMIAAAWGLLVLRLTLAFILWPHCLLYTSPSPRDRG